MQTATQQSCLDCALRPDRVFCDLPTNVLVAVDTVKSTIICPRNTVLFREGQPAKGVFVLCEGRAKLSVCSESGKPLTLHIAVPGEVLGLSAALSGGPYEVSAELLDNAQVAMVKRKDLLGFLREHREACLHVVDLLSQDLHIAYDWLRSSVWGVPAVRAPRPCKPMERRASPPTGLSLAPAETMEFHSRLLRLAPAVISHQSSLVSVQPKPLIRNPLSTKAF